MFEQLNLYLFSLINADAGLAGWRLGAAQVMAERLILLVPVALTALWMTGSRASRQNAVRACAAAVGALAFNQLLALLWFHPRPFMAGVGHTFLQHAPDSSFPSDHGSIMFAVALVLAFGGSGLARRIGKALLVVGVGVAWSRVYLGVHYPLDMAGALVVAGGVTMLVATRQAVVAGAALVGLLEGLYRRIFAAPIARGWLRP